MSQDSNGVIAIRPRLNLDSRLQLTRPEKLISHHYINDDDSRIREQPGRLLTIKGLSDYFQFESVKYWRRFPLVSHLQ